MELKRVLRKIFLPELERGLPIGESIDLWMTVQLSGDEKANKLNITVRQKLIEMFETALDLLDNIEGEVVNLHRVETTVPLLARVSFITNIEARLNEIWLMAHKEEETEEDRIIREAQNSMK